MFIFGSPLAGVALLACAAVVFVIARQEDNERDEATHRAIAKLMITQHVTAMTVTDRHGRKAHYRLERES